VGVTFVDYDHDRGLGPCTSQRRPMRVRRVRAPHNVLWRNNGNSTFTDVSAENGARFCGQRRQASSPTDFKQ